MNEEVIFSTLLAAGDLRTTGAADQAVKIVLEKPHRVVELLEGMVHAAAGVRMRSADALQKAASVQPMLIAPFKERILGIARTATQQEVQWHCAQLIRYLDLGPAEITEAERIMIGYLRNAKSAIVHADAIETLARLAVLDPTRQAEITLVIEAAIIKGSAAVVSRGKKALKTLTSISG